MGAARGCSKVTFTATMPHVLLKTAMDAAKCFTAEQFTKALFAARVMLRSNMKVYKTKHFATIHPPQSASTTHDGLRREGEDGPIYITAAAPVRTRAIETGKFGFNGGGNAYFTRP